MTRARRFRTLIPALALVALALPASASAQATRTWVSGVGDDANPCSRTAPCKTFAGSISKTAPGGIINCIDSGGFGALTITKSIMIKCNTVHAGMLASGGINAVNIAAGVNDKVVLNGLNIEGNGTTLGLNGIRITQAASVKLVNVDIGSFSRSGVSVEPNASTNVKLVVNHSNIFNNGGNGVNVAPQNNATARVHLRHNTLDDNGCGIVATRFGMTNVFTTNCGTAASAGIAGTAVINAFDNDISDSAFRGVFSRGTATTVRIGRNSVTGTVANPALEVLDGGALLSYGNNFVTGNPGGDGAPTGPITPARVGHR
jgi:hypothetical protein